LHLWGDLLVELELFDNQVEIVQESLFDILSDIIIKSWLNMERLIRLFDLLNPHVKRVKFFVDQILKVVRGVEDTIDRPHQEREEDKADKL
jgi:hypothetical protein